MKSIFTFLLGLTILSSCSSSSHEETKTSPSLSVEQQEEIRLVEVEKMIQTHLSSTSHNFPSIDFDNAVYPTFQFNTFPNYVAVNGKKMAITSNDKYSLDMPFPAGAFMTLTCLLDPRGISYKNGASLEQFIVGSTTEPFNLDAPHLQFIDPTYTSENGTLIDFCLFNTQLSRKGNYLKLTIDNEDSFYIYNNAAFYLRGLAQGSHSLQLALLNKNGHPISGPFNANEKSIRIHS